MQVNLSFLPNSLKDDESFRRAWRLAINATNRAAKSDLDRGVSSEKAGIETAAKATIAAAQLIRNEIDHGDFADLIPVDNFANEYAFTEGDIQTVRSFMNLLAQHSLVCADEAITAVPNVRKKSAKLTAAYRAGRLCAEFNLGMPTDYASDHHEKESVAISLMRCLLIASGADNNPSRSTLRRGTPAAKQGFEGFKPKTMRKL